MTIGDSPVTPALLFVDDERNVLRSLSRLFFDENYDIELAVSAKDALEILRKKIVHVIVSDQRMPEMTGVQFFVESQKIQPLAVKILLTGYTDLPAAQAAINEGQIYKFFTKPWQDIEIKLALKRALEHFFLQQQNRELLDITNRQNAELKELNLKLNQKVKERTETIVEQNKELGELNRRLADNFGKMIRVFLNFIEMKSPDLCGHSKRVAAAARYLADGLKLPENEIRAVEIAALLHDIGKIGLPEKILNQLENSMNAAEFDLYQKHPLIGQNLLLRIDTLKKESLIIRHHHENFNGSGFPDHLKAEAIPLGSRIIAAADYYDKMVNRVFQNTANPRKCAVESLNNATGAELDPNIASRMLQLVGERVAKEVITPDDKPYREIAIKPFQMKDGMILSRDLFTSRGTKILSKNRRLDMVDIKAVLDAERVEKLISDIYIFD